MSDNDSSLHTLKHRKDNYITMKMFICGHCGKENYPKPCNTLYRTCDAYVCNAICQQERVIAITKLDPMMINPTLWRLDS